MNSKIVKSTLVSAVILLGLFAGVLFTAMLAISPSLALLNASAYTLVKQEQIRILQVAMSSISTLYIIAGLYILYLARKEGLKKLFSLTLMALILVVIALLYSAFTDIPYNQQILKWDVASPPANWAEIRHKWDVANVARTVPTVIAFALQSASLFFVRPNEEK